jgi:F-type H+-transporting ATPase subunit b
MEFLSPMMLATGKASSGLGTVSGWLHDLFDFAGAEFWVFVAFLIFVALIVWKVRGKITSALDTRSDRIKAEIDEAQKLREEAQALLAEYQRKQRDAVQEIENMRRAAEEEAARVREKSEASLQVSLKRREQQALDRIAQAEIAAQSDVRDLAIDLAISATQKLLIDQLDKDKASSLIDDAIKNMPSKLH